MRVEDVEKLSRKQLRARANECFERGTADSGALLEAQFYLRELEHRADSLISIRDFILEIVVIALIGREIHMGYQQGNQQSKEFDAQQQISASLEASSAATAKTLVALQNTSTLMNAALQKQPALLHDLETTSAATATSLTSLRGTTDLMNAALQKQLAMLYDVSLEVTYAQYTNSDEKQISFVNHTRANISLWGLSFGTPTAPNISMEGRTIVPQRGTGFDGSKIYDYIGKVTKGGGGWIFFEVYLKSENGVEFVQHCRFSVTWDHETATIVTHTESVTAEQWSNRPPMPRVGP